MEHTDQKKKTLTPSETTTNDAFSSLGQNSNSTSKLLEADKEADEMSIKELIFKIRDCWKYLLTKWIVIVFAGLIGGIIGFAYAFYKKPIYKAELSFALEDEKSGGGLGGAAGLASLVGIDIGGSGGGAFTGDNLLELMKSRSMVEKALLTEVEVNGNKKTLVELYIDFNHLRDTWEKTPGLDKVQFLASDNPDLFNRIQDSLIGVFHKSLISNNLTVDKLDKKLSIIEVRVNSENELFSKYFAEVLAKVVSDFYIETKTKKSVENVSILQHQTDSVRRALNGAISGVATSIDANPNANPARLALRVPSQRRQVDVQANQAILTELVKNLEISKVSLRSETPLIQVIDKPILPLEIERVSKVKGFLTGLFISVFLMCLIISLRLLFKSIIS